MTMTFARPTPALDKAATQALAGLCFSLLLFIPQSAFAIPYFGDATSDNQARVATVTPPADNGGQRPPESRTYTPTDKLHLQKLNGVTLADTAYDSRDWAATVKDAANRTTTFVRQSNGDLKEAQLPASRTTKFFYDGDHRLTSTSNPGANSGPRNEAFAYTTTPDGLPRTHKTEADGRTVTSDFDSLGQLRFLKDRKGATFEFRYDALGRRTHIITPQGQTTITSYKKNGRVASVSEPSGDAAAFNYHATTGRLASIVYSGTAGGTVNYTGYDANGNVLALNENGANGITRTYDGLNRVTSYTFAGETIGYRYYPSGKLAKLIYPGGSESGTGHVAYIYNTDGRLHQVIDKLDSTTSPRTTTYQWNTDGRLASITRPNGTTRTITYDAAGRPNGIAESAGLNWTIGYWSSDDIRTLDVTPAIPANQLSAVPNATMTFDSANQLATFNGQNIAHDLDGNSLSTPTPTGGWMALSYDSRNRLTSADTTNYTYNAENNRVGITSPDETTTLVVDPEGTLPKVLSRTKNGITTRYVYGAGLQYEVNSSGEATYYHFNQTGNTAALSDQAGAMIERIAYSPYGTIRYRQSSFDTPFLYGGFFGVMTDANGLINMRARYYNPVTMRFLNSDPARDGLNWFAYAGGNPVNFADPTGFGASGILDAIQTGLDFLGFIPGLGAIPDIINAGISALRGDALGAGLSLAAAVPIIGDIAGAGKIAFSATRASRAARSATTSVATAAKVERSAAPVVTAARVAAKSIGNPGSNGFVLVGEGSLETASVVRRGQFVNRVYDSRYGVVDGVSGPLGRSFSPGSGVPTTAAETITGRGLQIYNTNNAQRAIIYRATGNIPATSRTSLGGTAPELLIDPSIFGSLAPVRNYPLVPGN